MRLLDYLTDPAVGPGFRAAFGACIASAFACGPIGLALALRRVSLAGHAVGHAAFAGVGLAAMIATLPAIASLGEASSEFVTLTIVAIVAAGLAAAAAWLGDHLSGSLDRPRTDAALAVVLVAGLALGGLLLEAAVVRARSLGLPAPPSFEAALFGSPLSIGGERAWVITLVAAMAFAACVIARRGLTWTAFDPTHAAAIGLRPKVWAVVTLALAAIAAVLAMRAVGVLLASALLTLPAVAALRFSRSALQAAVIATALGVLAVIVGFVVGAELDWPIGRAAALSACAIAGVCFAVPKPGSRSGDGPSLMTPEEGTPT